MASVARSMPLGPSAPAVTPDQSPLGSPPGEGSAATAGGGGTVGGGGGAAAGGWWGGGAGPPQAVAVAQSARQSSRDEDDDDSAGPCGRRGIPLADRRAARVPARRSATTQQNCAGGYG